ncbi:hypothetical protein K474DRAFT_811146 [Panus rudis PR-1116 ss-1]|nr:hypothetical protein K474DRAFT_811146 [Panus rudis PR-1116 ss-1]
MTSTSDDEEQEETHLRNRVRLQGTFPSAQGTAGRTTEDVDMDVGFDENDGGSSDYDFSCDIDDDALAAAEEAEHRYKIDKSNTNTMNSILESTVGTEARGTALEETRLQSTARTLVGTEDRDITMIAEEGASRFSSRSSSGPAPISVSQPIRRAGSSRPVASSSQARSSQRVDLGVIDLVDEGEDGDKENVPVSKRQRRAAPSQEDIIEISD